MTRPLSLAFTFDLVIDGDEHRVTNYPGDALRLRALAAPLSLDERLAAGGVEAYAVMFDFAWQAIRHLDKYHDLDWDDFADRCSDWSIVGDEPVRPTDAGPSSGP